MLTFDNRLHCAPLKDSCKRVLDAGCGTGIWSIDFGAQFVPFAYARAD
jgi:predicted RNA methylase